VVADAIAGEPAPTPKLPGNREMNRRFCRIAASGASEAANGGVVTGLPIRIPYSTEQGSLAQEQGILSAEIEITPG